MCVVLCFMLCARHFTYINSLKIFQLGRKEWKHGDLFWLLVLFLLICRISLYILGTTYLLVIDYVWF